MKPYGRPRRKHRANKKAKRQQQIKKIEQYFVSLLKCHAAMLQIQIHARSIRAKQDFPPGGIIGKVGDEFAIPSDNEPGSKYKSELVEFYKRKGQSETEADKNAELTILRHKREGVPTPGNINPIPNYIPHGEGSGSEYVIKTERTQSDVVQLLKELATIIKTTNPLPADTPCDSL